MPRTGSVPGNAASYKATNELGFSPGLHVSASARHQQGEDATEVLGADQKRVFSAT